ncbi:MAG TPA: hypothetical protein VJ742_06970 [Nitrososphaera sp.]|nr:hypothetical protein [Nitrososphaera sp.]
MVIELNLVFKDAYLEGEEEPLEFAHTLNAPDGFEVTGGQLFVENPKTSELQRFAFRIDRDSDGKANLVVVENPEA